MNDYVVPKEVITWLVMIAKSEVSPKHGTVKHAYGNGYIDCAKETLNKINVVYTKDTE